jgi:glycosyltransferase involved in cell wall biosynthesis
MKVCFITASLSRNAGGLQHSVRGLARACAAMSHVEKVQVLGVCDQHTDADIALWEPLSPQACPVLGPERFSYAPGLSVKLNELNPDILQLHGLWRYPSIVVAQWHRRTGKPYIVHPHGMLDPWAVRNSHWKKALAALFYEKGMLRKSACIRALCQSEAESIRKFGLRNPICIIPNGMESPEIRNPKSAIQNPPWTGLVAPGQKVMLYLGRIHPKKGLVNLLKAWTENQGREAWVLALAGWDEAGHEQELKQLATRLDLAWTDARDRGATGRAQTKKPKPEITSQSSKPPSVVFLGPQFGNAKAACYSGCEAFILPSFSEGLPMVILEAWSHSKPVIMTPECNLPEGFSADAGIMISANPQGIRTGLNRLFSMDAMETSKMGHNGRRLTAEKFNWQIIGEQLNAVTYWVAYGGPRPECIYVG